MFSVALITREQIAYNRFPRLIRPERPQAPKLALVHARRVSTGGVKRVNLILMGCGWRALARLPPAWFFAQGRPVKLEGVAGGGMVARRAHGCSKKIFEFCGNLREVAQGRQRRFEFAAFLA
jgi:hypothetical protein